MTFSAGSFGPEVGITSTPVIDMETGTLYVLARTKSAPRRQQRRILQQSACPCDYDRGRKVWWAKGDLRLCSGTGRGTNNGQIAFDPLKENPRAALTLVDKNVYIAWASSCDVDPYHGWVMAYDSQTLAQKSVLNVNPNGSEAGIWLSDTGPAADAEGNLYVPTGNGTFDAYSGGRDYGDSVLKLDGSSLAIRDYFTPHEEERISDADADLAPADRLCSLTCRAPIVILLFNRPRIRRSMSSTVTTWASSILTTTPWYIR